MLIWAPLTFLSPYKVANFAAESSHIIAPSDRDNQGWNVGLLRFKGDLLAVYRDNRMVQSLVEQSCSRTSGLRKTLYPFRTKRLGASAQGPRIPCQGATADKHFFAQKCFGNGDNEANSVFKYSSKTFLGRIYSMIRVR